MAGEPICIRRTATVEEADIIVAWLADRQLEARVLDHDSFQSTALGVTDIRGVAIVVVNQEAASRAVALLKDHEREQVEKVSHQAVSTKPTEVTCGECGGVSHILPGQVGKVIDCERCGAYLDVPS